MDIEITKLLVPAITGLFAGTIGSLIAPWVNWRIEKHRKSIEYKQDLIKDARKLVDNADSLEAILSSSLWGFISSHLTKEERYSFQAETICINQVSKGWTNWQCESKRYLTCFTA